MDLRVDHVFLFLCWLQISRQGKRFLETKLLKVYVKLLAHLSKEYDQSKVGGNSAQGQDG